MKYTPYFRESEAIPLDISTPIRGYMSTYFPSPSSTDIEEDTSTPVESEVEEIRTSSQPITSIPAPKDIIAPVQFGKIELDPSVDPGKMSGLLDEFRKHGISVKVTSGTRQGAKTKQGRTSFHSTGEAIDIVPIGQTYSQLRSQITSKPELVKYMRENGYGILDETTPEMLARTGGTGAHWHIGRDRIATDNFRQWFGKNGGVIPKYQNGKQLPDYEDLVKKVELYGRQFYQSNHWKNLSEQEKGKFMEYKVRSGMNNTAGQMAKFTGDLLSSPKRAIEAVVTKTTNNPNDWRTIMNPELGYYKSFGERSVSNWNPETSAGKIARGVVSTGVDLVTDPEVLLGGVAIGKNLGKRVISSSTRKGYMPLFGQNKAIAAEIALDYKPSTIDFSDSPLVSRLKTNTTRDIGLPETVDKSIFGYGYNEVYRFLNNYGIDLRSSNQSQEMFKANEELFGRLLSGEKIPTSEFIEKLKPITPIKPDGLKGISTQYYNGTSAVIVDNSESSKDVMRDYLLNTKYVDVPTDWENLSKVMGNHENIHLLDDIRWRSDEGYTLYANTIEKFLKDPSLLYTQKGTFSPTEINARVSEIKDFARIMDGNKTFTGDELHTLYKEFLGNGPANKAHEKLYNQITDWDKFAKWINSITPAALLAPSILGPSQDRTSRKKYQ